MYIYLELRSLSISLNILLLKLNIHFMPLPLMPKEALSLFLKFPLFSFENENVFQHKRLNVYKS